jgi:hypothetical protein
VNKQFFGQTKGAKSAIGLEQSSPTTAAMLLREYGLLLDTRALAKVLGFSTPKQAASALSSGRLPIPAARIAGRLQARVQDVADYIDGAVSQSRRRRATRTGADAYEMYARWAD